MLRRKILSPFQNVQEQGLLLKMKQLIKFKLNKKQQQKNSLYKNKTQ